MINIKLNLQGKTLVIKSDARQFVTWFEKNGKRTDSQYLPTLPKLLEFMSLQSLLHSDAQSLNELIAEYRIDKRRLQDFFSLNID